MPEKCILILLDGLGDRSYRELDFKTPLQAAQTPVLDRLAVASANGVYHAACMGQALPSENAHFIMFGYDIKELPGRGALEALGAEIEFQHKDVAILSHFSSITESLVSITFRSFQSEVLLSKKFLTPYPAPQYKFLEASKPFPIVSGTQTIP